MVSDTHETYRERTQDSNEGHWEMQSLYFFVMSVELRQEVLDHPTALHLP